MTESGLQGYDAVVWMGLIGARRHAARDRHKLARAANEALRSDSVLTPLRAQGFEPAGGSPGEFAR